MVGMEMLDFQLGDIEFTMVRCQVYVDLIEATGKVKSDGLFEGLHEES